MAIHIYHPNRSSKGFACSFWYSSRDNAIYATLIKQAGWDDKNQNGTFKANLNDPTKKVNIKFSPVEVSAILDCIERNRPFSVPHDTDGPFKQISFVPWMSKETTDAEGNPKAPIQNGFSFSITVSDKGNPSSKNPFYIGLTFPESRLIREFLIFSLHKYFYSISTVEVVKQAEPAKEVDQPQEQAEPVNNPPESKSNPVADPLADW